MKKLLLFVSLSSIFASNVYADQTPYASIVLLDSVNAISKYVTLDGYSNPSCEGNRMLIADNDAEYRKEMFAMVLSAFHAGTKVSFVFSVSNGQCYANRVFLTK